MEIHSTHLAILQPPFEYFDESVYSFELIDLAQSFFIKCLKTPITNEISIISQHSINQILDKKESIGSISI